MYERAQDEKGLGFTHSVVGDSLDECGDYAGAMETYTFHSLNLCSEYDSLVSSFITVLTCKLENVE